jgi:hypothetical protein
MFLVDWDRSPELRWIKQQCPLCREPTGPDSQCHKLGGSIVDEMDPDSSMGLSALGKSIEVNGQVVPIYSEQCMFRRYNNYIIETNFPLSKPLVEVIANTEGVEQFIVETKYRGIITIGNQFEERMVKVKVATKYREAIEHNRMVQEFMNEITANKSEIPDVADAVSDSTGEESG